MRAKNILSMMALFLVALVAARILWRHIPPLEQGFRSPVVQAENTGRSAPVPHIGRCPVFPADNVWNTPIQSVPNDPHSSRFIDSIGPLRTMHPDFASSSSIGIPYTEVPPGTRPVSVPFDYADESDQGHYPLYSAVPIEVGSDHHVIEVDERRCILYELFDVQLKPDGSWRAGSGAIYDLTSNGLRPDGHGSADAAGLPIFPGLVRYEEVLSGHIDHALRFTIPHTQGAYIWPARHKASRITDRDVLPMGSRLRLRSDFNVSKFSKNNQVILRALQKYGMFLADNGGPMFLSGVPDKRWDDDDLHKLNGVAAEDFEVVDESDLQLLPDSARVDPLAIAH
jgi:hypothetical protein